jgi:hypothetical protein
MRPSRSARSVCHKTIQGTHPSSAPHASPCHSRTASSAPPPFLGCESGRQRRRKLPGTAGGGVRGSLHVCRMSRARDSSGRLLVWPVAAVATTRSRAAWWHLLLLQGGYRDAQGPKLTKTLLCCVLGVPWHLVVHVDCSGHPCSLLGACTCCGQGWRCVGRQWCCGSCTVRAVPVPVCSAPLACRLARWYIHDV